MHTPSHRVDVVFAPDAAAHPRTAADLLDRSLAARGLSGELVFARDATEFAAATDAAAQRGEYIVVPGSGVPFPAPAGGVIRVDLGEPPPDRSPGVRVHIRGRGLEGLRFAVESWYHHRLHPAAIVAYGEHPDQRAALRIPHGPGPFPAVVLLHGGYWRARWEFDLMDALAIDLTARGYLTWNAEYRCADEYGWATMTRDVADAVQSLAAVAQADRSRVVLVGHSAGAQLALRAAADAVAGRAALRPILAVGLAGVLDLRLADERRLSEGATGAALGGRWPRRRAAYLSSSPIDRLPLGLPHVVVNAIDDDPNLVEMNRAYLTAAARSPDEVTGIEGPGGHFDVIDPAHELWSRAATAIHDAVNHHHPGT